MTGKLLNEVLGAAMLDMVTAGYVQLALRIHRTRPDMRLPGQSTQFRLLFGCCV